ncbi:4-hydroxy-tetrahydrodipicolinate reductase [Clostridium tarantellae]|uniref:4-hydroxy-tetrahydrodipicolinate reductase n=1 Tax=Clostridium tarantellae TaxID=39493 RepID=A0A6I1MJR1_9CLOT|nr:4-hydroxy-tetrahydrodipicolinate reductase [Clostridium tarantellae]MPQ42648.1 4-hydroxy-tetrahydrodipicolinate reductase [Clostridium tarantellae]
MVKIVLSGCSGKMGSTITNLALQKFPNIQIVAGIDKFTNVNRNYPIFEKAENCSVDYDVLLDFSRADTLTSLIELSKKTKKPLILCSTGYTDEDLDLIEKASKEIPLFRSANMSIGINLVNALLKKISPILYENFDFDIELVERHHNQKVDSPSGTALLLAHSIQNSLNEETNLIYGREGIGKREKNEICVNTVRGGGIIGDHEVIYAGDGEVIEVNHKAISRDVFAIGALKACEYMASQTKTGKYSMDDVLNINF